jgi:hypothetical protein
MFPLFALNRSGALLRLLISRSRKAEKECAADG